MGERWLARHQVFIFLCSFLLFAPKSTVKGYKQDTVQVFYESLCPDSRSFFINELVPTYEKMNGSIILDMIPYGKAFTSGNRIRCQHGAIECEGNMYHACVIDRVKNPLTQLMMVSCMIWNNFHPKRAAQRCADFHGVSFREIENCFRNQGEQLHLIAGDRTNSLNPKADFIPLIIVNEDRSNQKRFLHNLYGELVQRH